MRPFNFDPNSSAFLTPMKVTGAISVKVGVFCWLRLRRLTSHVIGAAGLCFRIQDAR